MNLEMLEEIHETVKFYDKTLKRFLLLLLVLVASYGSYKLGYKKGSEETYTAILNYLQQPDKPQSGVSS